MTRPAAIVALLVLFLSATAVVRPPAASAEGEAAPLPPGIMAQGVRIDGVDVGGMTRSAARAAVLAARVAPRLRPLLLTFRGTRFTISPRAAGFVAEVDDALTGALNFGRTRPVPPEGVDVPLRTRVDRSRLRAILRRRAPRLAVPALDAALSFRAGVPRVRRARAGAEVDLPAAEQQVATALLTRRFRSYALPARRVLPAVTSIGPVVVIDRGAFRLTVYRGERRVRAYPIAVGQPAYPTPAGLFRIIDKQRNPIWFPPASPWARGLGPVPPGVGNPLGTRWMGTSAPGIGIHGTPVARSIGTRASHGCIRMYIRDAEDLFDRVAIGTPVLIR